MVYTPEEKKKMENVMEAFADYTANHTEFDVAYSDKTGYVRLIIDECADPYFFPIKDFENLVDMFCMEIVAEEVDRQLSKDRSLMNWDVDYDIIRRRLQDYIERLDEAYQEQATKVINSYLIRRFLSPYLP